MNAGELSLRFLSFAFYGVLPALLGFVASGAMHAVYGWGWQTIVVLGGFALMVVALWFAVLTEAE